MVNHTLSKSNEIKEPKTFSSKASIDFDEKLKKDKNYNADYYFFENKKPTVENTLRKARERYFKKTNIDKHLRLHDFRHSCATWLFSISIPITGISKILKHGNISITMFTYIHLVKDDYTNALIKLNNIK